MVQGRVKGIGGQKVIVSTIGTLKWTFDNNDGRSHSFLIPGSLYVPSSPARLLSPQHWAQTQKDDYPVKNGTWQGTTSEEIFLNWEQRKYWRHIKYNAANVATRWTTPGSKRYRLFKAVFDRQVPEAEQESIGFNLTIITDDESEEWERDANGRWAPSYHDDESDSDDEGSLQPPLLSRASDTEESNDNAPLQTDKRVFELHRPQGAYAEQMRAAVRGNEQGQGKRNEQGHHQTKFERFAACKVIEDDVDVANELEQSKMTPRAKLISWHYQTGHLPFSRLQAMARKDIIPRRLADCRVPKCSACIYGQMTRRSKRSRLAANNVSGITITAPGQCVLVDQLKSSTPGFIAQMKGIPTTERYRGATVYVDHFSRLSFVYLHQRLTSEETVNRKRAFKQHCEARGVVVTHYHADNGRFADNLFVSHVTTNNQSISYCGVNAHWQNGITEKRIRDLQEQTRVMLLHAEAKWPKVITTNLWPYALRCANDALNNTPRGKDKKRNNRGIPMQVFTGSDVLTVVRHFHPFGCPMYVLNSKLQAGQSLPKWHERARLGVYLGRSPRNAQSVALVLNLSTGLVSPAFHVGFDDYFETIIDHTDHPNKWKSAAHFGHFNTTKRKVSKNPANNARTGLFGYQRSTQQSANKEVQENDDGQVHSDDDLPIEDEESTQEIEDEPPPAEQRSDPPEEVAEIAAPSATRQEVRWSARHKPTQHLRESGQYFGRAFASIETVDDNYDGEDKYEIQQAMQDPIAFAASSDPDIMYLNQATKQPDKKQFLRAMQDKVESHTKNKHWIIVPCSQVPNGMDILPTVWAMRRKQRIVSRGVNKWKARLNVHGGKQTKGVNYWETYAACLRWLSIRFFLIQSIMNKWHTRQVDFFLAYPQADIECDLYVETPSGLNFKGSRKTHCLKLLKNVYGQKQAGRVWQQHLFSGLKEMGFTQSESDECVFYKGSTVFMVYTDDGIFCGPNKSEIQSIIDEMSQQFNITDEGTIDKYLGMKVTHLPDGTISLTQPHLIDSIIKDMRFRENTQGKPTPLPSTIILQRDEEGGVHDKVWEYRLVIGKLNFLEKSTRPELLYSVHMAARLSNNPKASHSAAVCHIVRYLVDTQDKGIMLQPNDHSFTCFCDADFAGLWHRETAQHNSMTAKSRSAYIVMYAGCPVTWASKLQTKILLSSTESLYNACSEAAREVIGMMGLMKEIKERMCDKTVVIPTIRCTMFEDNKGAIALAKLPKIRPRTKHINVKVHWFRRFVKQGVLMLMPIDTLDQLADIGTKPLAEDLFKKPRKRIIGW